MFMNRARAVRLEIFPQAHHLKRFPSAGAVPFVALLEASLEMLEQKLIGERLEHLVRRCLTQQEQDALWLRCFEGLPVDVITRRLVCGKRSDQIAGILGYDYGHTVIHRDNLVIV